MLELRVVKSLFYRRGNLVASGRNYLLAVQVAGSLFGDHRLTFITFYLNSPVRNKCFQKNAEFIH